jgi:two-component system, OmpR family, phosphate regulon sensor histidine kinase PhoR
VTIRAAWACALGLAVAATGASARAQSNAEFSVRPAAPGRFAVYRARLDQRAIEGFVVDADALVDTLQRRVLEDQGLGNLARVMAARQQPKAYASSRSSLDLPSASQLGFESAYRFNHRFADPFTAIEARLDLAPLDDQGAADLLFAFAAGLALAIVLGLYALYRMAAVRVRFAERRNNFVAAVSHELKTPLTAIRMYSEMLRDGMVEDDQKRQQYYDTITAETERLSRLINNVLELSRLERHERPVQLVAADVTPLVREVVEVFRPHALQAGFELELAADADLPAAQFDRDALTQVLFNLLDNALKYGAAPERRIAVRCTRSEHGGVCVSVVDHGQGVADSQLRAIFEPFYRAQTELTRTQQGTGIGLALVHGLCTRMHGAVEGRNLRPGFEVRVTLQGA